MRPLAQPDRVAGIENGSDEHHHVAAIERERRKPVEVALSGDRGDARHGRQGAERLQRGEPGAEEKPRADQDQRRDRALDDR